MRFFFFFFNLNKGEQLKTAIVSLKMAETSSSNTEPLTFDNEILISICLELSGNGVWPISVIWS